ncbi:GSHB synthetase, partial [Amia calva]|nr:GSHB synthetase [Amia calva]
LTLDPALTYTQHITTLTRTCRFFLSNIHRIRPFLADYATQLLDQSLVLSRLDYCNALLVGLPATTTECMNEIAIALFEGTQKDDIIQKINQISLSDSTAVKRTEVLAEDLLDQIKSAIKKAKCISLALDESTDKTDNTQRLVFVRFFDEEKGEFCEDVLGLTALHGHTRGDDIYEALIQMLRDREIDLKHVISIATDGAPCMTGRERVLVARLRAHHPDLIAYHCIIHQMVLCASLEEKYAEVMTTVMRLVNFLRASSALQHRLLRSFLTEVNAEFDDLLLHNNVRWLSKGKVLERFWTLRKELETFLLDQKSAKAKQFVDFMQNEEKMEIVAFLSDITSHLNDLNMKLQGKNNTVCNLTSVVCAFQKKLELFKCDLQQDLLHFPKLLNQTAGTHHHHNHAEFLDKLIKNFQTRFGDFPLGKQVLLCMETRFLVMASVPEDVLMNEALIEDLQKLAKDTALLQGILMRTKETPNSSEVVSYAAFTLFPSPVPRSLFEQARQVQTHFNLLVDRISQDAEFLEQALARHILKVAGRVEEQKNILDNNPAAGSAKAIAKSWELYGSEQAVVMFLVEDDEINIYDHRCVENELWSRNITIIRRDFNDVSKRASLDQNKRLFIDGKEVAIVYFRSGLMPQDYTEQGWEARLMMERSRAVKCPDISTHLAGTKKVQQEMSRPGVLERFFPDDPKAVAQIRATFAGLYSLDMGEEGDRTVAMAIANPDHFVLKPQREGGGNNIYGEDICQVLESVKENSERCAYILMDKIRPQPVRNYLLRSGSPLKLSTCLSELGMFGAYVRQGKGMVLNECTGHLLRTKSAEHSDGGLTTGVAVLDNPLLV